MPWLRHFALFVVFVAALLKPAAAGAFVSAPDANAQARVGAFELVAATLVGPASGATCGLHEGIGAAYDENASGYRFAPEGGLGPNRLRGRDAATPTSGEGGVYQFEIDGKIKTGSTGDFHARYGGQNITKEFPQTRFEAAADDAAYRWTPRRQRRFDEHYLDSLISPELRYRSPRRPVSPVSQSKWERFKHIFGYGD